MIIGLTGSYGGGKDTIADYLKDKGFAYHSLSDILRDELHARDLPITRENLIDIGNEIRTKYGAGEIAARALKKIRENGEANTLVVSIRNPEEVKVLRVEPDFQMWFVDAPSRLRYDRTAKRGRSDDFASYEDFLEKERIENSTDPHAQQLSKVAKMADVKIVNDRTLKELYQKVDAVLASSGIDP